MNGMIIDRTNRIKKQKRKGFFIADCARGLLFALLIFIPFYVFHFQPKWEHEEFEEKMAEMDAWHEQRKLEEANLTEDDTFKFVFGDIGKDVVRDVIVNHENDTIYVMVTSGNQATEEYLKNAYDLEMAFLPFAQDGDDPYELCIVGQSVYGDDLWIIDRYGTVADMHGNWLYQF